jgi:DNA excision repair protein ERCC-3
MEIGRILRPKKGGASTNFSAYFYSLVSSDTEEMYFATKRQQFLVDQGYEFKIITNLTAGGEGGGDGSIIYSALPDQLSLLNTVLLSSESDWVEEEDDIGAVMVPQEDRDTLVSRRSTKSLASLSGSDAMAYLEYNRGTTSGLSK